MVLASILGLGISLVPCFMFGLIIMIAFLLCNCEYIGETVAKHFCAWKNRRKTRLKSNNGGKCISGSSKNKLGELSSIKLSTEAIMMRNRFNLSIINFGNGTENSTNASAPAAPALGLWDDNNFPPVRDGESTLISRHSESRVEELESDPPPSYDECIQPIIPHPTQNLNETTNAQSLLEMKTQTDAKEKEQ